MSIKAVIFDRDNTIVHFDQHALAELERRLATLAPLLPRGAAAAFWASWPGPWPRTEQEEPHFWHMFWSALVERYRLPTSALEPLIALGGFYHTCFRAFPDTRACLARLRARGLRLAVLTNFQLPSVHLTLRHAGIDPAWFDLLCSSATLGVEKPDPRAYLAVAEALGLPPGACAFIDDLPANVAGARAVGMHALLIDRHGSAEAGALRRIHSLDLLPHVLQHAPATLST